MDFKVTYLDGGLGAMTDRSGFLSDSDFVLRCQRSRRYKSQIRDVVTTCRTTGKRKITAGVESHGYSAFEDGSSVSVVNAAAHAAVTATAGYQNAGMYSYADNMNGLSSYAAAAAAAAMPQNLFTAAIDHNSRSFLAPENLFHYSRHALGTYYPEYHHNMAQYPTNGFLDHMTTTRTAHCFPSAYATDTSGIVEKNTDKLYGCQLANESKFGVTESVNTNGRSLSKTSCCDSYMTTATTPCSLMSASATIHQPLLAETKIADMPTHRNFGLSTTPNDCLSVIKHKAGLPILTSNASPLRNDHNSIDANTTSSISTTSTSILSAFSTANNLDSRQSVLMWGTTPSFSGRTKYGLTPNDVKPNERVVSCKWNGSIANPKPLSPHPSVAHSPSSAKVPMSMPLTGYSTQAYSTTEVSPIEVSILTHCH
jgi:hypothetical protein